MKTITINEGTDYTETYYLSQLEPGMEYRMWEILGSSQCVPRSYKIVYQGQSGIYPGTIEDMRQSEKEKVMDKLVDLGILDVEVTKVACFTYKDYMIGKDYSA